jgi:hypothetical protein
LNVLEDLQPKVVAKAKYPVNKKKLVSHKNSFLK